MGIISGLLTSEIEIHPLQEGLYFRLPNSTWPGRQAGSYKHTKLHAIHYYVLPNVQLNAACNSAAPISCAFAYTCPWSHLAFSNGIKKSSHSRLIEKCCRRNLWREKKAHTHTHSISSKSYRNQTIPRPNRIVFKAESSVCCVLLTEGKSRIREYIATWSV